eukprot:TRINITY_DN6563_c0_g1_i5.p1 TRINITY_DN6563_c0_g1~~TRINITY_DN6563_c0_g1_i5.p1  ORF type:complete len:874 (-),score=206.96 TRINITY_DN6563_c0_g1_i5:103-2724(-)
MCIRDRYKTFIRNNKPPFFKNIDNLEVNWSGSFQVYLQGLDLQVINSIIKSETLYQLDTGNLGPIQKNSIQNFQSHFAELENANESDEKYVPGYVLQILGLKQGELKENDAFVFRDFVYQQAPETYIKSLKYVLESRRFGGVRNYSVYPFEFSPTIQHLVKSKGIFDSSDLATLANSTDVLLYFNVQSLIGQSQNLQVLREFRGGDVYSSFSQVFSNASASQTIGKGDISPDDAESLLSTLKTVTNQLYPNPSASEKGKCLNPINFAPSKNKSIVLKPENVPEFLRNQFSGFELKNFVIDDQVGPSDDPVGDSNDRDVSFPKPLPSLRQGIQSISAYLQSFEGVNEQLVLQITNNTVLEEKKSFTFGYPFKIEGIVAKLIPLEEVDEKSPLSQSKIDLIDKYNSQGLKQDEPKFLALVNLKRFPRPWISGRIGFAALESLQQPFLDVLVRPADESLSIENGLTLANRYKKGKKAVILAPYAGEVVEINEYDESTHAVKYRETKNQHVYRIFEPGDFFSYETVPNYTTESCKFQDILNESSKILSKFNPDTVKEFITRLLGSLRVSIQDNYHIDVGLKLLQFEQGSNGVPTHFNPTIINLSKDQDEESKEHYIQAIDSPINLISFDIQLLELVKNYLRRHQLLWETVLGANQSTINEGLIEFKENISQELLSHILNASKFAAENHWSEAFGKSKVLESIFENAFRTDEIEGIVKFNRKKPIEEQSKFGEGRVDVNFIIPQQNGVWIPPFYSDTPPAHQLGDRVIIINTLNISGAPFGAIGTISAVGQNIVEVILDVPSFSATSLGDRCPNFRGVYLLSEDVFNFARYVTYEVETGLFEPVPKTLEKWGNKPICDYILANSFGLGNVDLSDFQFV